MEVSYPRLPPTAVPSAPVCLPARLNTALRTHTRRVAWPLSALFCCLRGCVRHACACVSLRLHCLPTPPCPCDEWAGLLAPLAEGVQQREGREGGMWCACTHVLLFTVKTQIRCFQIRFHSLSVTYSCDRGLATVVIKPSPYIMLKLSKLC